MSDTQMKKTYIFSMSLDVEKVCERYKLKTYEDKVLQKSFKTTRLIDLNRDHNDTPETISFLDESKRSHSCNISMIDFNSCKNILALKYHCFWDRHPFTTSPIGCPIRYVPNNAVKKYFSHVSKDMYTLKEKVSNNITNNNDPLITIKKNTYYETDGVFCSFNCCQAWIEHHKHDRRYDDSETLLAKIYNEYNKTKSVVIMASRHWRMLEMYGGHLTIRKFRDGFNKIEYESHGMCKNPIFKPLASLYQEKLHF